MKSFLLICILLLTGCSVQAKIESKPKELDNCKIKILHDERLDGLNYITVFEYDGNKFIILNHNEMLQIQGNSNDG